MANDIGIRIGLEGIAQYQRDLTKGLQTTEFISGKIGSAFAGAQNSFSAFANEVPIVGNALRLLTNPIALAGGAVVGLGATLSAFTKTAATFEEQLSGVGALLNLDRTDEAFTQLSDKARQLGRDTEFSATEAGAAMENLARAGFSVNEILTATEQTLALATVGSLDLARAAEIASDTLNQFNLPAEEIGRVVDVIAKTTVSSATNVNQFAEAMNYLGVTAKAFGIPIEEASAAIGIFANNGLKGSLATRAFGTSLTRLSKPTGEAAALIEQLGIQAFDSQGQFIGLADLIANLETAFDGLTDQDRQAAITTIFGAEAIQEFNILLKEGSTGIRQYTAEIKAAGDQQGAFAQNIRQQKLDNFYGQVKLLSSAWEEFQLAITLRVLPAFSGLVASLAEGVRAAATFINTAGGLGGVVRENLVPIILVTTALLAYNSQAIAAAVANAAYELSFLKLLIVEDAALLKTRLLAGATAIYGTASKVLSGQLSILTIAQRAFNLALTANPIGLVIVAVGALAAGLVYLYRESQTFRAIIAGVWNVLKEGAAYFSELINNTVGLKTALLLMAGPVGLLFVDFSRLRAGIAEALKSINEFVDSSLILKGAFIAITGPIGIAITLFDTFRDQFNRLGSIVADAAGRVVDAFGSIQTAIQDLIGVDLANALINTFTGPLIAFAGDVFDIGKSIAASFTRGYREKIAEEEFGDIAKNIASSANMIAAAGAGKKVGAEFLGGLKDQVEGDGKEIASANSLKALQDKLSEVNKQIEVADPNSTTFATLARQSRDLQSKIDAITDRINGTTKATETLAQTFAKLGVSLPAIQQLDDLQSKLNAVTDTINDNPQSTQFTELIQQIAGLDVAVANAKQNLSDLGLSGIPSLDSLQNRIVDLNVLLNTGASDVTLFQALIDEASALQDEINTTNQQLQNIGTQASPESLASFQALQDQLTAVQAKIQEVGADNAAFSALIEQANTLRSGILDASGSIVSLGDLTGASLDTLETKFRNINQAIQLVNPDSSAFAVLIQQAGELEKEIDRIKARIETISSGVDPDPVVVPINPDVSKLADLGIIPAPLTVLVTPKIEPIDFPTTSLTELQAAISVLESQINAARGSLSNLTGDDFLKQVGNIKTMEDQLSTLQQKAFDIAPTFQELSEKLGIDFQFLTQNFANSIEALDALNTPFAQILSNLGATNTEVLKVIESFKDLGREAVKTALTSIGNGISDVARSFGVALAEGQKFSGGLQALFSVLVSALLVDVPRLLGLFLLETAVGLAFPAGIPFAIGGLALLGLSGLASGLLEGAANKRANKNIEIAAPAAQDVANVFTPPAAVGQSQASFLDLSSFNTATPPPVNVTVQIGNEDIGEQLLLYINTQRQLTG